MPKTVKQVDEQVKLLNELMGYRDVEWNTVGAISFRGINPHEFGLAIIINPGGGISTFVKGKLGYLSTYLGGMIMGVMLNNEANNKKGTN